MVAINPGKRTRQARDAQRKQDINALANASIGYYTLAGNYPRENTCDSSRGRGASCPITTPELDWPYPSNSYFYQELVTNQEFLKKLPKDPVNDTTFYYRYEPKADTQDACGGASPPCTIYWIGVRLESVDNQAEAGRRVFRCSDNTNLPPDASGVSQGAGCKEVLYPPSNNFDTTNNLF
ncbi:MAG: hypothetical protein UU34_C0009G0004 [Candidatus Curtissbacteria bacterium GW2011_GWA1_41_11]|uniref:Uncharacterized protein n=1 Tax=Candidatus Curtissbacteria bacterium GW2011_GWA1_41_11 TaxID=1618409 RepID=A0A0G0UH47_9BACT|nr:MAG: hypothetical protein UU34_C0009G0004 [Candidatus Curtissbacteria bacterium GW2011_GWA1_41_11]